MKPYASRHIIYAAPPPISIDPPDPCGNGAMTATVIHAVTRPSDNQVRSGRFFRPTPVALAS